MSYRPDVQDVLVVADTTNSANQLIGALHKAGFDGYCVAQISLATELMVHGRWRTVAVDDKVPDYQRLLDWLKDKKFPESAAWTFANSNELLNRLGTKTTL